MSNKKMSNKKKKKRLIGKCASRTFCAGFDENTEERRGERTK